MMIKFIGCMATFLVFTVSAAIAQVVPCPPGGGDCNIAPRGARYYPAPNPCPVYPAVNGHSLKGAPVTRRAYNTDCGNSVKAYPLDDVARQRYYDRQALGENVPSANRFGAYPGDRYGIFAPETDYNFENLLERCLVKDINSKNHNIKIICLDAFDRALNDPSYAAKHKELISTLVGYIKANVPPNGAIERPDLNMAVEILARNHRLDRDKCFNFPELNMDKVRQYLESRSNVICGFEGKKDDQIITTRGAYINPNTKAVAILEGDEIVAIPDDTMPSYYVGFTNADGKFRVGFNGEVYYSDEDGRFINTKGRYIVGPDGEFITVDGDYKIGPNGKSIIGSNGEVYTVDAEGRYIGPDGKPLMGKNGGYIGPDGEYVIIDGRRYITDSEGRVSTDGRYIIGPDGKPVYIGTHGKAGLSDAEKAKAAHLKATLEDPRYPELLEENKKLKAKKDAEDNIIDAEISSKYDTEEAISGLSCSRSFCQSEVISKGNLRIMLDNVKTTLNNRRANIASRLEAICTAKCISIEDRDLEPDAIKTLASYVRRRVPWILTANPRPVKEVKTVRPDVQAALYVIGAKDRSKSIGSEINLTATNLIGADLSEANLANVDLSFSNLATTDLGNAKGLTRWNKIHLVAIDETTRIPQAVSAGFIVVKNPDIIPPQPGNFKVTTDDWYFWHSILVKKPIKKK